MEIIQFLEGVSPWWWVILAFALGSIEVATMSFFLIWPALAALAMAGFLVITPDISGTAQIAIYAILSIIFTFVGRFLLYKYGDGGGTADQTLNNRSSQLIGRPATVLDFNAGDGAVEIEGTRWQAQWADGETAKVGTTVRVTKADPMMVYVENVK